MAKGTSTRTPPDWIKKTTSIAEDINKYYSKYKSIRAVGGSAKDASEALARALSALDGGPIAIDEALVDAVEKDTAYIRSITPVGVPLPYVVSKEELRDLAGENPAKQLAVRDSIEKQFIEYADIIKRYETQRDAAKIILDQSTASRMAIAELARLLQQLIETPAHHWFNYPVATRLVHSWYDITGPLDAKLSDREQAAEKLHQTYLDVLSNINKNAEIRELSREWNNMVRSLLQRRISLRAHEDIRKASLGLVLEFNKSLPSAVDRFESLMMQSKVLDKKMKSRAEMYLKKIHEWDALRQKELEEYKAAPRKDVPQGWVGGMPDAFQPPAIPGWKPEIPDSPGYSPTPVPAAPGSSFPPGWPNIEYPIPVPPFEPPPLPHLPTWPLPPVPDIPYPPWGGGGGGGGVGGGGGGGIALPAFP